MPVSDVLPICFPDLANLFVIWSPVSDLLLCRCIGEYGIDLFVYPKSIFSSLDFPPYLAGVYRWDNWLLSEMILREDVNVVDISNPALPILVNDGVEPVAHQSADGAQYNDRITKSRSGNQYKLGHANNADYRLEGICPQCSLVKNPIQSIGVLLAKRINRFGYLAVLTFEQTSNDLPAMDLLHNWICWTKRIAFTNYVILVQDPAVAAHLASHSIPVIQRADPLAAQKGNVATLPGDSAVLSPDAGPDFASFHLNVLQSVLKSGYHFLTGPTTSIWLDDPLIYLSERMDVQATVNTSVFHPPATASFSTLAATDSILVGSSPYWAVRATTYGQYFTKQVKDCLVKSVILPRTMRAEWDCVADSWKIIKRNKHVKRGLLTPNKFTQGNAYLLQHAPQKAGGHCTHALNHTVLERKNFPGLVQPPIYIASVRQHCTSCFSLSLGDVEVSPWLDVFCCFRC